MVTSLLVVLSLYFLFLQLDCFFMWWVLVEGHAIVEGSIGVVYDVELLCMLMVCGGVLVEGWKWHVGLSVGFLVGLPCRFC